MYSLIIAHLYPFGPVWILTLSWSDKWVTVLYIYLLLNTPPPPRYIPLLPFLVKYPSSPNLPPPKLTTVSAPPPPP